jgi:hypothetical protein
MIAVSGDRLGVTTGVNGQRLCVVTRTGRSVAVADAPGKAECLEPSGQLGDARHTREIGRQGQRALDAAPPTWISDVQHQSINARDVSGKDLDQRHHDPVPAERAASPEAGMDGDRDIGASRSFCLKDSRSEAGVGRRDR